MANTLYRLINPPVRALLRSPLHGLMSRNTLLLSFNGRKTGKLLSTPIGYYEKDNAAHCFTNRSFLWWKNLTNRQTVQLTIRGRTWHSTSEVEAEDHAKMALQLDAFLRAVPRDASHAGVALLPDGSPSPPDIERVVPQMVYLKFPLIA